jgi:hypothetical protein
MVHLSNRPHNSHFITLTIVGWVDLFSRPVLTVLMIIKSLYQRKGLSVDAYRTNRDI